MSDAAYALVIVVVGLAAILAGVAAWTGRWRSWVHFGLGRWGIVTWLLPGIGGAWLLFGLLMLFARDADGPLVVALLFAALAMGLAGFVGWFLCSFATPSRLRWMQPGYFWDHYEHDPWWGRARDMQE